MATLYEKYITGRDDHWNFHSVDWKAQTFTPGTAHTITSVKIQAYRAGSPGTITVSIQGVDGSGHPDGSDICSGTTDGDTLPTAAYEWREITLGAGALLASGTKYAIVCRALTGSAGNEVGWGMDATSPTYAGGCVEVSADSGSSWTSWTAYDYMFEDWGDPVVSAFTPRVMIF